MRRISVEIGPRSYDVVVSPGARRLLAPEIGRVAPRAGLCVIVTQAPLVAAGWIDDLSTGIEHHVIEIGQGEDVKSLGTVESLCREFVRVGLTRNDLVIAVGGGMVSDVAGFAASIYHRGMNYLTVATTLLAQVDAAVGGKTGVNLPEGKNLVGAFHQPLVVLADTELLSSLPPREWNCGRGEMAKYAFLGSTAPSNALLMMDLEDQVAECVALKAQIVAEDERELGRRMILNYGHTLAHALEAVGLEQRSAGVTTQTSALAHGEAVAIGVVFAAELASALGRIDSRRVELHREVVGGFDLNCELPSGLNARELVDLMARDKKAHHDLTFALDGPKGVEPVAGVDPAVVLATLLEMGAEQ